MENVGEGGSYTGHGERAGLETMTGDSSAGSFIDSSVLGSMFEFHFVSLCCWCCRR